MVTPPATSPIAAPRPQQGVLPPSSGERRPPATVSPSAAVVRDAPDVNRLQARLRQLELQRGVTGGQNRALQAYQALDQIQERDRISALLGIDEYA